MSAGHIYLDGRDLERDQGVLMRFHLTYQGDLFTSQPPKDGEPDRRGPHIDALTVPLSKYGSPRGMDGNPLPPQDGETPLFVLLDDDRQITHLEVETDALLSAPDGSSDAYVQLSVLVEIRPYHTNMFNLSFA